MKLKRIFKWTALALLMLLVGWSQFAYWTSTNDCGRSIPVGAERMKTIKNCDYGPADQVLKLAQVAKPVPNENQILVRVRAVSLRFFDGGMLEGSVPGRLLFGLRKPKNTIPGSDFAGTVEAIGRDVTEFKPGEEVFGVRAGCLAEYICIRADRGAVVTKPANVNFEQAAAIPTALVSLQGLRDTGRVTAGQKVLINGASGGVGTFAVQIAKSMGAEVTGVCSGKNAELVRSLGADHVIDYTKEDFAKSGEHYDVILDNVPNHSLAECRAVLTPEGKYVMIGGGGPNDNRWVGPFGRVIHAIFLKPFSKQDVGMMMANSNATDLTFLAQLMESGKVKPVIDRTYKLSELRDAIG